jgi:hypothetical protein
MDNSPLGWIANFKPNPGLRYVEELAIRCIEERAFYQRWYVLEKDGERTVGYREIP